MSADNWTTCPRCVARHEARIKEREAEVEAAYGTVPVDEFDRMRDSLATERSAEIQRTWREDYEFYGAEDGAVSVDYSGGCTECKLTLKFEHEHPFYPEAGAS